MLFKSKMETEVWEYYNIPKLSSSIPASSTLNVLWEKNQLQSCDRI